MDLQTDEPPKIAVPEGTQAGPEGLADPCLTGIPAPDLSNVSDAERCTYHGTDITIGWLSGTVRRDVLNGDLYYVWSAPVDVRVNSDCHEATVSWVTYTDTPDPNTGARGGRLSKTFRKRQAGRSTVSQAPTWEVLYYGLSGLYARATSGTLTVLVEPGYVKNGVEHKMAPWVACKAKTFYFTATPNGPNITHASERKVVCPGWE